MQQFREPLGTPVFAARDNKVFGVQNAAYVVEAAVVNWNPREPPRGNLAVQASDGQIVRQGEHFLSPLHCLGNCLVAKLENSMDESALAIIHLPLGRTGIDQHLELLFADLGILLILPPR